MVSQVGQLFGGERKIGSFAKKGPFGGGED